MKEGGKRGEEGRRVICNLMHFSPTPLLRHCIISPFGRREGRERGAKDDLRGYFSPMDDDKSAIGGGGVIAEKCNDDRHYRESWDASDRQRNGKTESAGSKKRQGSARASGNVTESGKKGARRKMTAAEKVEWRGPSLV